MEWETINNLYFEYFGENMKELIGIAILVASLFGGTKLVGFIHTEVRIAALKKAAQGLPPLSRSSPRTH